MGVGWSALDADDTHRLSTRGRRRNDGVRQLARRVGAVRRIGNHREHLLDVGVGRRELDAEKPGDITAGARLGRDDL